MRSFRCVPFLGPTATLCSSRDLYLVVELSDNEMNPKYSNVWLDGVVAAPFGE